jgi:enoyl-CoA hydratase/carnithine racemase
VLGSLGDLGVPSFAFVNGLALGGGLEIALNSTYRTVDASAAAIALPEVFLGSSPAGAARTCCRTSSASRTRSRSSSQPAQAEPHAEAAAGVRLGIIDAIFPAATYLEDSLRLGRRGAHGRRQGRAQERAGQDRAPHQVAHRHQDGPRHARIQDRHRPPLPYAALDLLDKAKSGTKAEGFAREDEALADLVTGDQFAASMYAFDLVQKRAKRPVGAPDKALAKKVTKVGIIGAGLMASQFALLFVRKLQVPVLITDLDQARVDKGVAYIHDEIGKLEAKGRLDADAANKLRALVTGTTDKSLYADCDFVIEAVFEEVGVKQAVFGEIEKIVAEDAILATNTSSLSVAEIGSKLAHPERLVGFHFFNPVAVMPLIEIVKTPDTTDAALSTAFVVAKGLGKNAVLTADAPGFVVNRLLAKVMGEAARAVYEGTPSRMSRRRSRRSACRWDRSSSSISSAGRSPRTCRTRWSTRSPTASTRTRTSTSSPSCRRSSRRTRADGSPASPRPPRRR